MVKTKDKVGINTLYLGPFYDYTYQLVTEKKSNHHKYKMMYIMK